MGVMFDIKNLEYARVLDNRAALSVTKDKDKEHRKRRQKGMLKNSLKQATKKRRKYPCKNINWTMLIKRSMILTTVKLREELF